MNQPIPITLLNQARQKPQSYQAAVIRSESFWQRQNRQIAESSQALSALGRAMSLTLSAMLDFHIPDQSPTLGRKRRRRRARGRQIQMNQRGHHA